jgi:phosphonate degradation associated HDIG domain protein
MRETMTASVVDEIFTLFDRFGSDLYGEDATQLLHALQAAELARRAGCGEALIAAALLHDVGQFIDDAGNAAETLRVDARHEISGAAFLSRHFPMAVTEPVRLHVAAKRYLCRVEPAYRGALSDASRLSLELQGGAMDEAEAQVFAAEEFFADAIALRRFDDQGKQPNWYPDDLASYRPLLESLLIR